MPLRHVSTSRRVMRSTRAFSGAARARCARARARASRAGDPRSRAALVRVVVPASEVERIARWRGRARDSDDDDDDDATTDARSTSAIGRRMMFVTNAIAACAVVVSGTADVARALEDVPERYARLARDVVDALRTSLEHEAVDVSASASERFKYAEPAKKAVKAYLSYEGSAGARESASYADIAEALRELSAFYKRNGATTPLTEETRTKILTLLTEASASLPPPEPSLMDKVLERLA